MKRVRINKYTYSGTFHPSCGVRQGCIFSPILFNLYGEYVIRKTLQIETDSGITEWDGGVLVGGAQISNIRYADDTTLISKDVESMKFLLRRLESVSAEFSLIINRAKTKMMIVNRPQNNCPEIHEIEGIEVVNRFTYLGSFVENRGGCEAEICHRAQIARSTMSRLSKVWIDTEISKDLKKNVIKALVFSVFLYGAETWTVREADRRRIDAFEMWCWKRLLRIPWTAKRTNSLILKEIG